VIVLHVTGGDDNSQVFEEGPLAHLIDGEQRGLGHVRYRSCFSGLIQLERETIPFGTDFYGTVYYAAPTGSAAGTFGAIRSSAARSLSDSKPI
jgi:hypothetical protein